MSGGQPSESAIPGSAALVARSSSDPKDPSLPPSDPSTTTGRIRDAEPTTLTPGVRPTGPIYRSEQQRAKSVYRRANPWYRRLARGLIGLAFAGTGAAALYLGAREVQDYLNRDRLPTAGAEIPAYRTTTFQVSSSAPAPALDGTLSIDVTTGAFEFTSRPVPDRPPIHLVSPDGARVLVDESGVWRHAALGDIAVADVVGAIPFLVGIDTADDILVNRMRNGYVDLVERETEGIGTNTRDRYRISIDVAGYNADQPLQWQSFQAEVVPAIGDTGAAELTFWLDPDDMLVRMVHAGTNWSWERVSRSAEPIRLPDAALAAALAAG
jgi:hypothetical protein